MTSVDIDPYARYCIDVGGWVYCSTLHTLRKSSTLKSLLAHPPEDGSLIFIDRDGSAFQFVLNFLRNGTVHPIEDRAFTEFLIGEASYYGLRRMESQLSSQLTERPRSDLNDVVIELRAIKQHLKTLTDNMVDDKTVRRGITRSSSANTMADRSADT